MLKQRKAAFSISPNIVVAIGVLFTSFSSIFVRSSDAPALVIGMYRMLFSVVLLLPFLITERIKIRKSAAPSDAKKARSGDYLLCVLSGVFLAIHFWTWFESLERTSIASSTVLVDTHPIFVLIFGFIFFRERVTRKALLYVVLALAGIAILSFGDLVAGTDTFSGDLLALAGAATVSGYMLIGRSVRQRIPAFTYVAIVYSVSTLTLFIIGQGASIRFTGYPGKEYLIFLGIAFFCTLLGHTLFNWALKYLKTSFISMAVLTEPLYATVLGIIILREIPGGTVFLGGAIILLGVFMFVKEEGKMSEDTSFDKKAETWDQNPVQIERNAAVANAIRRIIPIKSNMRALDCGAGTGLLSMNLARELSSILALDTSDGMLQVFNKKLELPENRDLDIETRNHDLSKIPLDTEPFNLIITAMTLHHVEDPDSLLARFYELLETGGYLAIIELDAEDGSFHGSDASAAHHGFATEDLKHRLEGHGFTSIKYEEVFKMERHGGVYPVNIITSAKG
ncbi:MAG: EamA family transporter [Spirochaetales bacterium]|jgi:drug/metabolite transporter (DMT)-like permease/ubiquinone/menaquinone biosynthesis C-methylase UbiE|nr:EamA family transporter [Spirochaetales bacterium]